MTGLRRSEVAQLAGLSAEYYAKIEQGRSGRPSDSTIEAIANALRLNDPDRVALLRSVDYYFGMPGASGAIDPARGTTTQPDPAFLVLDDLTQILDASPLAALLLLDQIERRPSGRNLARLSFQEWRPSAPGTEASRRLSIAVLSNAARVARSARLERHVGHLCIHCPEFSQAWTQRAWPSEQGSGIELPVWHDVTGHVRLEVRLQREGAGRSIGWTRVLLLPPSTEGGLGLLRSWLPDYG